MVSFGAELARLIVGTISGSVKGGSYDNRGGLPSLFAGLPGGGSYPAFIRSRRTADSERPLPGLAVVPD